jgi:hypothetical protein
MPIINSYKIPGNRSGSVSLSDKVTSTAVVRFAVETDDSSHDADYVLLNVPWQVGDSYNGYRINNVSVTESSEDGQTWVADVTYGGESLPDNPLTLPATYSVQYQDIEIPIEFDAAGNPIVNTAGDPFAEAATLHDATPLYVIKKNFAAYPSAIFNALRRTVNATSFLGVAPGEARFAGGSSDLENDDTWGPYWPSSFQFAVAVGDWQLHLLNQGFRELVGGQRRLILINGHPVDQPVLLAASGAALPPAGAPVTLDFDRYTPADYNLILGI